MTAKEMFKELGYSSVEDCSMIDYYQGENENYLVIRFWKTQGNIELFGGLWKEFNLNNYQYFVSNYKLFIAINKQISELGWDNE